MSSSQIKQRASDLERDVLKLMRQMDFLSLILSYRMRIWNEKYLQEWINEVIELSATYSRVMALLNTSDHITEIKESVFDKFWIRAQDLLFMDPLRLVEGLIPENITREIRNGGSFIFNESRSKEPTTATSSTSEEEQLKQPERILDLATRLAVHQLTQTFIEGEGPRFNIQNVLFLTRNDAEKQIVVGEIKALFQIGGASQSLLVLDVNQINEKFEVLELARWLEQITITELQTKDDNVLLASKTERHKMVMSKYHRHLVLLVDGDGDKKLDPWKVRFMKKTDSADVVVFITSQSSAHQNDELAMEVDLRIRTEDHLLPWEVFCRNVGSELVWSSSDIQRIAMQIVKECGGHLHAIVLMAKSLKNVKDVELWELAMENLRYPNLCYEIWGVKHVSQVMFNAFINIIWADEIFEREKPRLTSCLRVFKFQDSAISENELFFHWYLEELADSQEDAEHTLRELVERSILLQYEDYRTQYILMPKEIRIILEALPDTDSYWDLNEGALGLIRPLEFWDWYGARCFTISFFQLKVLDLSSTSIHDLPNSICYLKELRKFYLKDCELFFKLPSEIGRLENLKKLDLDGTQITHLPNEIQELTNLESLSLSFSGYHGKKSNPYSKCAMIPLGFLSKLTHLKDLRIDVNPENVWWQENVEHVLAEISRLERLRTLDLYVPQVKFLWLIARPPIHFRFIVGHHMQRIISRAPPAVEFKFKQSNRSLRFINGVDFPIEVKNILEHAMALFLDRHMTLNSLSQIGLRYLHRLELCFLAECNEMQSIVDASEKSSWRGAFQSLKFLTIFYMKNLRSIINGPIPNNSFCRLKFLALHTCPELTTIFTMRLLVDLLCLEELVVEDCPKISCIISCQSWERGEDMFLPRLRKLSLLYLPELVTISNGLHIGRNLEKIGFYYCPKLKSLSVAEMSSRKLEVIRAETRWWEALKWSEAQWGQKCEPDHFSHIFVPIDEEVDVLSQLTTDDVDVFRRKGFF